MKIIILFIGIVLSNISLGAAHLGISYSDSLTTLEQETRSSSGSAGFSFDLGTYFNIGLTYRNQYSYIKGYEQDEDTKEIQYSETKMNLSSYSLDLSIILYPGDVFVPYVFGGLVIKNLSSRKEFPNSPPIIRDGKGIPDWQGGAGVGLRFSERFTLKYSRTWTPGTKLLKDGTAQRVTDYYQTFGLSYKI